MKAYNIAIASDHNGYILKSQIINYLNNKGYKVLDHGPKNEDSVDYPDYAYKVTESLLEEEARFGILICGTGIGMSIAANRKSWIRAALCFNNFMAERARLHNDANVLVLGSKILKQEEAIIMLDKFLSTNFEGGRHTRRLEKIT